METQIDRIRKMEEVMDVAAGTLHALKKALEQYSKISGKLRELETYYTKGQWREDFEDDEAGKLPKELKRGVLSEDGIYDLLRFRDEVIAKLAEVAERDR